MSLEQEFYLYCVSRFFQSMLGTCYVIESSFSIDGLRVDIGVYKGDRKIFGGSVPKAILPAMQPFLNVLKSNFERSCAGG